MMISRLVLAVGALALLAGLANAKEWTKVTLATDSDYMPYVKLTPDGKSVKEGLEVDLAADLCKRMKVECTWVVQEKDLIPALTAGKYDAILATMNIAKNAGVVYSVPYTTMRATFAVPKSGSLADLPDTGKRVVLD